MPSRPKLGGFVGEVDHAALAHRVGLRLKNARRRARVPLEEMADRLGITQQRLSRLERGLFLARLDDLKRAALAFRVPLSDFVEGE